MFFVMVFVMFGSAFCATPEKSYEDIDLDAGSHLRKVHFFEDQGESEGAVGLGIESHEARASEVNSRQRCVDLFCGLPEENPFDSLWFQNDCSVCVWYWQKEEVHSAFFDVTNALFNVQYCVPNGMFSWKNVRMIQPLDECLKEQFDLGFRQESHSNSSFIVVWGNESVVCREGYEHSTFYSKVLQEFVTQTCPMLLRNPSKWHIKTHPDNHILSANVLENMVGRFTSIRWSFVEKATLKKELERPQYNPTVLLALKGVGVVKGVPELNLWRDERIVPDDCALYAILKGCKIQSNVENLWTLDKYQKCINYQS